MGAVYRALHTKLDREVAVKVLTPARTSDPDIEQRFQREMRIIGLLDHPNIVRASDAGEVDGTHYLVMDLIDGRDLSEIAKANGQLPVGLACELIRQAAVGLQHACEQGLVHRDIKPSNLILDTSGTVKLLDMGLARLRGEQATPEDMTTTGQVMGTVDYMAPEQASDTHSVDIRADIYSLGCTLFHLLCGRPPFREPELTGVLKKMMAHAQKPVPPVSQFRNDVPDGLVAVLIRSLEKDPEDRFQQPSEFGESLESYCSDVALPELLTTDNPSHISAPEAAKEPTASPISSAQTDTQTTPKAKPEGSGRGNGSARKKLLLRFAAPLFVTLLAGVIYFTTGQGELELKVYRDDITVKIDGVKQEVHIDSPRDHYVLKFPASAGSHELEVSSSGFNIHTDQFRIFRNSKVELEARLTPYVKPQSPGTRSIPFVSNRNVDSSDPMSEVELLKDYVPPEFTSVGKPGQADNVIHGIIPQPESIAGIKRWQVETNEPRSEIWGVDWNADGTQIACGTHNGLIRIYRSSDLELLNVLHWSYKLR